MVINNNNFSAFNLKCIEYNSLFRNIQSCVPELLGSTSFKILDYVVKIRNMSSNIMYCEFSGSQP